MPATATRPPTAAPRPGGASADHSDADATGRRGSAVRGLALAAVSAGVAATLAGVVLGAFSLVSFPAFGNSHVLSALTTVGQVAALALAVAGVLAVRRGEGGTGLGRRFDPALLVRAGKLLLPASAALLVAATLAIPLAATRLYLLGVSVDQEFRTQFLTRSTSTTGLPDMAYADLPSFYPSGWFWLGGRFANLVGLPGWEAFKPWSVISLSVAAALVTVLWTRLLRTDLGGVTALVSVALLLAFGSPEPYGAVVALFAPPALLLAWHAVHPTGRHLGRAATAGTLLYLGVSACFYTLYTALAAATVCLMALVAAVAAWRRARTTSPGPATPGIAAPPPADHPAWLPLVRLAVIGCGSAVVALTVWAPYLLAAAGGGVAEGGTAFHYLPGAGAVLPAPWVAGGIPGLLCLVGLVWIVVRCRSSRRAQALGIGVAATYLWCLASMAMTALGTTLLGFRTEVVLVLELGVAGTFAIAELCGLVVGRGRDSRPDWEARVVGGRTVAAFATLAVVAALVFVQSIPNLLHSEIRVAYTDTDGAGERADRYPPGPQSHYAEVAKVIDAATGRPPTDVVVASTADAFLSFRPYLAYQAVTSHYANPLGRYAERNAAMQRWGEAETGEELWKAVSDTPWRRPDAIVARPSGAGYALRLAVDSYPNDPNVTRVPVTIPASAVEGPHFEVREVGPFAVILVR